MLVGDITVSDPREALHDLSNSPKVGVGIVLLFRDALELIGNPYSTETTLKFAKPWESLLPNIGNPLRDSEPRSGRLYPLAA